MSTRARRPVITGYGLISPLGNDPQTLFAALLAGRSGVRRIRAFDPAPAAWTTLEGVNIKLFRARPAEGGGRPGEVLAVAPGLRVATGRGAVEISEVQPAGRSRMTAEAWGRGRGVRTGEVLE